MFFWILIKCSIQVIDVHGIDRILYALLVAYRRRKGAYLWQPSVDGGVFQYQTYANEKDRFLGTLPRSSLPEISHLLVSSSNAPPPALYLQMALVNVMDARKTGDFGSDVGTDCILR